jgi:hypothetical protein
MHWAVLLSVVAYFGKYVHSKTNWSIPSVSDILCYVQLHANIHSDINSGGATSPLHTKEMFQRIANVKSYVYRYYQKSIKVFHSPSDAQVNCLKNNFKVYIKIDIKTAPTCFSAVTIIIRECIT